MDEIIHPWSRSTSFFLSLFSVSPTMWQRVLHPSQAIFFLFPACLLSSLRTINDIRETRSNVVADVLSLISYEISLYVLLKAEYR